MERTVSAEAADLWKRQPSVITDLILEAAAARSVPS